MSAKNLVNHLVPGRYASIPAKRTPAAPKVTKSTNPNAGLPPVSTSAYQKTAAGQVQNSSGAYVGKLDVWAHLNRFLILGTSGSSYYASERKMTVDMAKAVEAAVKYNGISTVDLIVEISQAGAAPKNDPALLALAICVAKGDDSTKAYAMNQLPKVARISTHLFDFLTYVQAMRGWGRTLKEGVANWYTSKDLNPLAMQMTKYRQRNGWTHRDVLRLAHPKPTSESMNNLFKWAIKGPEALERGAEIPEQVIGFEKAKTAGSGTLVKLIQDYRLTWEMIPTEMLNDANVFHALVMSMNLEAMIRNLPRITNLNLLLTREVRDRILSLLRNAEEIKAKRYHPLKALVARKTYASGRGLKGSMTWVPNAEVARALEDTFYLGFDAVEPTGKRLLLGIDVSGSMTMGQVGGMPLAPYEAVAAMAMVTARCEPLAEILGFSYNLQDLGIKNTDTLAQVLKKVQLARFGSTNPGALIQYAAKKGNVEGLVVYTDNEVNQGSSVAAEMKKYRTKASVARATMTVVGMTVNNFTLADPKDPDMLDIVGFDTAAPAVMSEFIKGTF